MRQSILRSQTFYALEKGGTKQKSDLTHIYKKDFRLFIGFLVAQYKNAELKQATS